MSQQCLKAYKALFDSSLLCGKVAAITGGGSGIGFTIAEVLMRHGCDTAIISRNLNKLKEAAELLQQATGRKCIPISADVRDPKEINSAFDHVLTNFGKIDIVVNNAAGNFLCPLSGMSPNAFKVVMDIDAVGTFNTSKTAFDKYFKDHGGVILNISATLHYNGRVMQAHAGAAKAAIDALTKHMAAEWGQHNIRVVGLAPGAIADTVGYNKLGGNLVSDKLAQSIPLQRAGTRLDIAQAALYLVSDAGSYVTGHTLVVDGGSWLNPVNGMSEAAALVSALNSKL